MHADTSRRGHSRAARRAATAWCTAAAVLLPGIARAADIEFIDAYRNLAFTQTADGAAITPAGAFYSSTVHTGGAAAYSGGSVTVPGGAVLPLAAQAGTRFAYQSPLLASQAAMDAAFQPGGYAYALSPSAPPEVASYTLGSDVYPLSQPYLSGSSWSALQGLNAAAPITLSFSAFTVNPAASLSNIFFTVYDYTLGQFIYDSGFLPATTPGLTLLPGSFQSGHSYGWELIFDSRVQAPAAGTQFGVLLGYDLRTTGTFTTAVPEPATWVLWAAGLWLLMRRGALRYDRS